ARAKLAKLDCNALNQRVGVFSNANECKPQTVRFTHEIGHTSIDILEARSTSHQLQHMRRPYCAARSEVAARTSEPMRGALEAGGVTRRHATSDFGNDARDLHPEDLRQLAQQRPISFDPSQNAPHEIGRA